MKKIFQLIDRRIIAFLHDVVMVMIAWVGAYLARYNFHSIPVISMSEAIKLIPILLSIQIGFFVFFGLYRSVWRFASLPDLIQIIKAVFFASAIFVFYLHLTHHLVAQSIPVLYAVFLLIFLCFGRLSVRWYKDRSNYFSHQDEKRVLIVGSGDVSESLIREMLRDLQSQYRPVAIVDSDPSKRNREIHRIRIVDSFGKIQAVVKQYQIDMIFIALTHVSAKEMNLILEECDRAGIPYRTISSFKEMIEGKLLSSMREVNLEDLLGRETYQIDMNLFHKAVCDKKVLVTGGGGSIGSELCRQIASLNPAELLIIDHCEANLYRIDYELRERFPALKLTIALLDIFQLNTLERFFKKHKPHLVFHAAAYKHVPMLEKQILVAVRNNVIGSKNVIDMAIQYQAEIFVQISTDKAVNPTNIMGMTKRIAEMYCQHFDESVKTKMITVRFGNVLGSVGSVVPLFKEQLQRGGPLTVTHPDITRYFMTIPEACRLILQAMTMGMGGEIFVLDMGEPIKIKQLAEQMIRLAGKKVDRDIKIVYSGLRPGEKLWEDLFYEKEEMMQTQHKKVFRAKANNIDSTFIQASISDIVRYCHYQQESVVLDSCIKLVPEYQGESKSVFVHESADNAVNV